MPFDFPQPLEERYRPKTISDFIGLEKPRKVLERFCANPFPSAWAFIGPSGTGKTTMALALASMLPAELHHIPSRNCDLETIENVCRSCHYVPLNAPFHLVLVDEADQMTPAAQLALLSKLDATAAPPNTIFIFTMNDTARLETRFLSRCRSLEFQMDTSKNDLLGHLQKIARAEGYRFPDSLKAIVKDSSTNVRDALTRLEVELLSGEKLEVVPAKEVKKHTHHCSACGITVEHDDPNCRIPHNTSCRQMYAACRDKEQAQRKSA